MDKRDITSTIKKVAEKFIGNYDDKIFFFMILSFDMTTPGAINLYKALENYVRSAPNINTGGFLISAFINGLQNVYNGTCKDYELVSTLYDLAIGELTSYLEDFDPTACDFEDGWNFEEEKL